MFHHLSLFITSWLSPVGSTKLHHDHYRAIQSQENQKMCSSKNNPGQQNNDGEQFQWQGGLYPDLSGLFGGEAGERRSGEGREGREGTPAGIALLLRLLGLSQEQVQPAPSAPPAEEEQQGRRCDCHHRHHQPDLVPLILSKCCQFSLQMTKHMVRVASPLLLLITIFLMPRSIIYSAVFMMLSAGLGLHMPTLVAGQVLYALLSFTDPLLITFICIFAIHKTVVRKKPLIDMNYWKRRIAGMENCRMN